MMDVFNPMGRTVHGASRTQNRSATSLMRALGRGEDAAASSGIAPAAPTLRWNWSEKCESVGFESFARERALAVASQDAPAKPN
jgi:hypothetical protein